jgi:ABC-type lipoprotein export system ATPase subunit
MSNINLAVKNATKIYGRGDQENYVFKNLNLTVEKGTM